MIKVGVDIHGVIDKMPEFFSFLSNAIILSGGEFHVITGSHWNSELEEKLKLMGIKWTNHFSVYDYLIETESPIIGEIIFPDGTIQKKFESSNWDIVKGKYCRENNISIHIDDGIIYKDYFTTPFCMLWTKN